jgi:hypothetical protein
MVEYSAAVQNQRASFLVPELKAATVVPNRVGLPKVCAGAFAIVYELQESGNTWAIRCFTKEVGDLQERYAAIAEHLKKVRLAHFVSFDYVKEGILVNGKPYPIMKMQWVEGVPLNRYVEQHLNDAGRLLALATQFGELSADLERHKIGHGDLSADNVLVTGHAIRLIDYDGMYVPKLSGRKARELGNAAFQHPRRNETLFGPEVDRFSVLLTGTALAALAADPTLWKRHGGGNGLLFSPVDLRDPNGSSLFRALRAAPEPTLKTLADELAKWCEANPAKLGKLPALKGLKIKRAAVQVPPAAAVAVAAAGGVTVALTLAVPNGAAAPVTPTGPAAALGSAANAVAGSAAAAAVKAAATSTLAGWWQRRKRRGGGQAVGQAAPAAVGPAAAGPAAAPPAAAPWVPRLAPAAAAASGPAAPAAVVRLAAPPVPQPAPASAAQAVAVPAPGKAPIDWTGIVVTALGLGFFSILFAPETQSLSMLAFPAIMALVVWADVASQRAASPAGSASVFVTAVGAGLFSILFAPETQSLSLVALPVVLALVIAGRRATIGRPPSAPTSSSNSTP